MVLRRGLLERLQRRWTVSLTTVVAPGGFGKTTLLRQAVERREAGRDVVVRCRSFERDARQFAGSVATALGLPDPPDGDDPVALADRLAAALGSLSPTPVCLVVDDVHLLGETSGATELLVAVARNLPGNAHLVVCGRSLPGVPLARFRAADDLLEIGADDLRFTPDEMAEMADLHEVDVSVMSALPHWPALVRLAIAAGEDASMDYLREEVLASMAHDLRVGLATAVLAGGVDDETLGREAPGLTALALADRIPLVELHPDGTAHAHALWADVLHQVVDHEELGALVAGVARSRSAAGRHDEAIDLAVGHGQWDLFDDLVMRSVRSGTSFVSASSAQRWLEAIPKDRRERPEVLVLRGLHARLVQGGAHGEEFVARAREAFARSGDITSEAAALSELTWFRWTRRDVKGILEVYRRSLEIEQVRPGLLISIIRIVEAAMADLSGDPHGAVAILAGLELPGSDPQLQAFVLNWLASLYVLTGDTAAGVRATRQAVRVAERFGGRPMQVVLSSWFHGDPEAAMAGVRDWAGADDRISARDQLLTDVYNAVISASFGRAIPVDVETLRAKGAGHGRDLVFAAMAGAARLVVNGDERAAAGLLADVVTRCGPDDPLALGEFVRFLPYTLVLLPDVRAQVLGRRLGRTHHRNRALADLFLALRARQPADWSALPTPHEVFTAFPLPWTIELAAWAHGEGRSDGLAIADAAIELAGDPAREALRALATAGGADGGAASLLAALPRPPDQRIEISILGPTEVVREGAVVEGGELTRRRVRELLTLLAARGSMTRDAVMTALWPDLDAERAANNLAVTLSRVRLVLEPDRKKGEAPFHLRQQGDRLELRSGDHLSVDLWQARLEVTEGQRAERAGDLTGAAAAFEMAAARWRGESLEDLRLLDDARDDGIGIDRMLVDAACRSGELHLAGHRPDRAKALAARVLQHDPLTERAHRLLIAAELQSDGPAAARAALERCRSVFAAAGLPVASSTVRLAGDPEPDPA